MSGCGCRYGGNQHGRWVTLCPPHWAQMSMTAMILGKTVDDCVNDALLLYAERHHPDFKRWVA